MSSIKRHLFPDLTTVSTECAVTKCHSLYGVQHMVGVCFLSSVLVSNGLTLRTIINSRWRITELLCELSHSSLGKL